MHCYIYFKAIIKLLSDESMLKTLSKNCLSTSQQYDFDKMIPQYIEYFNNPQLKTITANLSNSEQAIIDSMQNNHNQHARRIKAFKVAQKVIPKPVKKKLVAAINKSYNYLNK